MEIFETPQITGNTLILRIESFSEAYHKIETFREVIGQIPTVSVSGELMSDEGEYVTIKTPTKVYGWKNFGFLIYYNGEKGLYRPEDMDTSETFLFLGV